MWKKFVDWLKKTWVAIVLVWIAKQLWNLVSDFEKDADPWKIGAIGIILLCSAGGIFIFIKIEALDIARLGVLTTVIGFGITFATMLFNQSRKSDLALIQKAGGNQITGGENTPPIMGA